MQNDDVLEAIRRGDVSALEQFLLANPTAVTARVDGQRTLLHVATDWPGHFPHVRQTIHVLAAHGAALNAAFHGHHSETPLHWAASSDDLVALDALLELSADIESPGSVIDGGTPLPDAVAFRQWQAARRLIAHGARSTIWQAAALGMMDRLQQYFTGDSKPSADEVTNAFWNACHGGQLEAARYLLALKLLYPAAPSPHTRSRSAFTQAYTLRPWDDFRLSDHFNWFSSISELKHTAAEEK